MGQSEKVLKSMTSAHPEFMERTELLSNHLHTAFYQSFSLRREALPCRERRLGIKELSTQRLPCFHLCSARRLVKLELLFLYKLSHKFGHRAISQKARLGKTGEDHTESGSARSWSSRVIPEPGPCPDGSGTSPVREAPNPPGQPAPVRGHRRRALL